jgi:hypothetical protein
MPYFIRNGTAVSGPFTAKALKELAAAGELAPDDEVSEDGRVWLSARSVRGFLAVGESESMPLGDATGHRPFDLFISYSHENKLEADAICGKLEAIGIRCWIAPRDILPGTEWADGIMDGIENSRAMVLVFSQHANRSPQVRREVERAISKQLPLIPFRVQNTLPTRAMEYCLGNTHWLDAFDPPLEAHIHRLATVVRRLLADSDRFSGTGPTESHGADPQSGSVGSVKRSPAVAVSAALSRAAQAAGRFARRLRVRRAGFPRWAYFAIFSAVQLLVVLLVVNALVRPDRRVEAVEFSLVLWSVFGVAQYFFLSPVLRPQVGGGPGKPAWIWVSMGVAGLLC